MDARRLLQFAGIAVATLVGVSGIVDAHVAAGQQANGWAAVFRCLMLLGVVAGFRYTTGVHPRTGRWMPFGVLAFQMFAAIHVAQELVFLLAAEIPLIVRSRRAVVWCIGLAAIVVALSIGASWLGDFEVSGSVAHTPKAVAIVLTVATSLVWILFAFSCGYLILQLEESRDATLWAKAQLEASQHLLSDTARVGERLRISRELHDSIGHNLMGLSISLEVASQVTNEAALKPIQRAQLVARMLVAETREVLSSLRADPFPTLRPALEQLSAAIRRPVCHLDVPDDLAVGPAAARVLFRCAQEAMTNAARYSAAEHFHLAIARRDGRIVFEARDDGRGASRICPGNGLRGMKERLNELGGDLEIESAAGRGVILRGWLPAEDDRA